MTRPRLTNATLPTGLKYRVLDIEQALRWAYQSEIPKRQEDRPIAAMPPQPVHPMWRAGVFGGRIDCWHREPGFPAAMGDPHADALRIEAAVDALDEDGIDITSYAIAAGMGEHVDLPHVVAMVRRDLRAWILTCAKRGNRPDLGGGPICEPGLSSNGKPTVWRTMQTPAGTDSQGQALFITSDVAVVSRGDARDTGTFCKLFWSRTQDDVLEDRARYALWHAALVYLAADLADIVQDISVTAPAVAMKPWIEPEPVVRHALANLAVPRRQMLDARRPVARRAAGRRSEPVRRIDPRSWKPLAERLG